MDDTVTAETPRELVLTQWRLTAIGGHRPGSPYVEAVWLGLLGPSATWAWQRLARQAEARPGTRIDTVDLAISLGLGERLGKNASLSRTLHRLESFEVIQRDSDRLAVRVRLPDVPVRRLSRLSPTARLAHQRFSLEGRSGGRDSVVELSVGVGV